MAKSVSGFCRAFGTAAAVMTLISITNPAKADITHSVWMVASNADGTSIPYYWTCPDSQQHDWYYENSGTWQMVTPTGVPVATVSLVRIDIHGDPQVNLSFAVQAGASATSFTILSALNDFSATPIVGGTATTSASISLTDSNFNGISTLTGDIGGFAYRAAYNGYVPGGTTYTSLIPSFSTAASSSNAGPDLLPGTQFDMSSMFAFTLSPRDSASGTSTYEIVPSPAGAVLLGMGGLASCRRRRR